MKAGTRRTASQIVQEHFNPGELGKAGGPLFGVQLFHDGFQDWVVMILPSGGFFTLAGWLLLFNWLRERRERTRLLPAEALR